LRDDALFGTAGHDGWSAAGLLWRGSMPSGSSHLAAKIVRSVAGMLQTWSRTGW